MRCVLCLCVGTTASCLWVTPVAGYSAGQWLTASVSGAVEWCQLSWGGGCLLALPVCVMYMYVEDHCVCVPRVEKPWTIVHGFDVISFRTHNTSLEGATTLKFAPFCSS